MSRKSDGENEIVVSDEGEVVAPANDTVEPVEMVGFRISIPKTVYDQIDKLTGTIDVKVGIVAAIEAGVVCGRAEILKKVRAEMNAMLDALEADIE